MEKEKILKLFNEYIKNVDTEEISSIWKIKNKEFQDFWSERIINNTDKELNETEVNEIIRILDIKAKGNKKEYQAIANVLIPQGVWSRMFNEIKTNEDLKNMLSKIFKAEGRELIEPIDELYKINETRKNSLTGKSSNAINAMLAAFNINKYISVVSLNDRKRIIDFFGFSDGPDFEKDSQGKKVYLSNVTIIEGFSNLGIETTPRILSMFLYKSIKDYWKKDLEEEPEGPEQVNVETSDEDKATFMMEEQLEDFLIKNWEKADFSKNLELINDNDGNLVSQQFKTGIGEIDILVRDKNSKQYVIIELKRNQTSDDTIGQIARYMGWVEEHLSKGQSAKGIIIASKYDDKLRYALKKINDVTVYQYEVDFKLKEFKKS